MTSRTIYLVFSEEYGEIEGMFDEKGKLIHAWDCNDANWREYFDPLMKKLGIKVDYTQLGNEILQLDLIKHFGGPLND